MTRRPHITIANGDAPVALGLAGWREAAEGTVADIGVSRGLLLGWLEGEGKNS